MRRAWLDCNKSDIINAKNYIIDPTIKSYFEVVLTLMVSLQIVLRLTGRERSTFGLLHEFMQGRKYVFTKGVEDNIVKLIQKGFIFIVLELFKFKFLVCLFSNVHSCLTYF